MFLSCLDTTSILNVDDDSKVKSKNVREKKEESIENVLSNNELSIKGQTFKYSAHTDAF